MHRGRQSNGALRPVLLVWVVHFAKKIDQPPTLGLKAPWLLQERCAAVSREPGVVHAPELRCGVRGRPPGVYQPAPRVYQTLIYITKKFYMSLTLIRRARASRLSAARCACDTARARHPARADGRGLLVVRFLWCTPRTARFVATVGQIFWRLRRAARSDLDESKACGTHEHALGGLSTKSYSRFVLRCSRKEPSTNFRRLRRAVVLCTHNLASLACGSIVRPSCYENRSSECLRHRTQTRKYVAFLRSATANPKFSAPAAS